MFAPIEKHLDLPVTFIAKNSKTRKYFEERGVSYRRYPAFPDVVIMARQTAYKYPVSRIKKVGFDHGLYQFKRWTSTKYYNQFHVYFVSSENQVELAGDRGIGTTVAIGYPKLDQAFDGTYNEESLSKIKEDWGLDPEKPTVIFTSTWSGGGLSALSRWIDQVHTLTGKYNILMTVHTWTDKRDIEKLKNIPTACFLNGSDVVKGLLIADVFVGDASSIIGEFCALDKPIITFRVPESDRSIPAVKELIAGISTQIDEFDEIERAIVHCLTNPGELSPARKKANELIHYRLDGQAGKRAADIIKEVVGDKGS
jgi:CDP-glycerol glycerophosphotransferase (TagB/SpsB family)